MRFPAEVIGQAPRHRLHPRLVLDRDAHVVQHVAQVGGELVAGDPVLGQRDLDVDPGLDQLAGRGRGLLVIAHAEDPAQGAGHVAAHAQHRVHERLDLGPMTVQPGRDRIDQVEHVVDDDVHHQARGHRVQVGLARLADVDHGPALRPVQADPGVSLGHRGQP